MEANVTPHDDRSRQADRHRPPEPDKAQPHDGLPRDTVREVRDNTLRGLQPDPGDEPSSSRPSPVVVPSQDDPEPLAADCGPAAPGTDPTQSGKPRREGPAPHLKATVTTVPPGWFNGPGVGNKAEYSPPKPAPEPTEHKTLETETIKLDPAADPRKQITERKLRPPPAESEPPTQTKAAVRPSRRPIVVALAVGIAAVVVAVALGLRSRAKRPAKAVSDRPAQTTAGGAKVTAPSRSASVAAPIAPRATPTASVAPRSAGSTGSAPAAAPSAVAPPTTATEHHAMPAHAAPRGTPHVASKPKARVRHPGKQPAASTATPVAPAPAGSAARTPEAKADPDRPFL